LVANNSPAGLPGWGDWNRRKGQAIDDNAADRGNRKCCELASCLARAKSAPETITNLNPILRSNLSVEPSLNELARGGNQTRQERIVSRRKGALSGLQPRLDIGDRRQVANA
jgi:hypothetical protein